MKTHEEILKEISIIVLGTKWKDGYCSNWDWLIKQITIITSINKTAKDLAKNIHYLMSATGWK